MDQRALGWIGVVLMVGGCAGSERVDGASASQCEALCAQFERCDSSTDELECRTDCEEDEAFSGAFWGSVHQCVAEELSCDEIAGPEYGDCLRDNLRASEPSPAAAEACSVMATRADECNAEIDQSAFEEECVGFFAKVASDALISGVRACYEDSSCDRIAGCVAEVLDDFDVDGAAGDGWVPLPSSPAMSEPPEPTPEEQWYEICLEACRKSNECFEIDESCEYCSDVVGDGECSNEGEIWEHIDSCTAVECGPHGETYEQCLRETPECL